MSFPASILEVEAAFLQEAEKFFKSPEIQGHLGQACIEGLRRKQFETVITDAFQNDKSLKGGMLLAIAITLSRWIRKNIEEKRVGIVLPPGIGATLANIACVLCDKTPVNLNFTMGKAANESAIRQAELQTILTADALIQRYPDFPWTERRLNLIEILKSFSKLKFLFWRTAILLLPTKCIADFLKVPTEGGDKEVALLFTSGSSGEPKGVQLSHRNILANIKQIDLVLPSDEYHPILGCLPIFHSFGFTVTLWWPATTGPHVITYITPLEAPKLAEIIERFKIALLITTPTFLRGFLKRAHPEQLQSLKMVVTGAEKLPIALLEEFEKKFNITVCEGYGATETSPVISVNLPDLTDARDASEIRRKIGTVGRPLAGIAIKVTNMETGETQSPSHTGLLWYRGANVFNGYLNNPEKNAQVLQDGWYCSGDVGHLDEEGFLTIEGRESRFSKIGGEMVPHGTIEQKLSEICAKLDPPQQNANGNGVNAVVMGVDDPVKGESLVALTTSMQDPMLLRKKLTESKLPNLWIPKIIKHVSTIPVLASGKLDLKNCQLLADEAYEQTHNS